MSIRYIDEPPVCEWCGCEMPFRGGKKYCTSSCRNYAWREKIEKRKSKKERAKVLGYIKRRKDVMQFAQYLPLIKKFNKHFAVHKNKKFKGKKLDVLNETHNFLKSDNPSKFKQKISSNLKILEGKQKR